jgi:hypothetical protein
MCTDEFSAAEGDTLEGIALIDGWWRVTQGDAIGVFPSSHCEVRWDFDWGLNRLRAIPTACPRQPLPNPLLVVGCVFQGFHCPTYL